MFVTFSKFLNLHDCKLFYLIVAIKRDCLTICYLNKTLSQRQLFLKIRNILRYMHITLHSSEQTRTNLIHTFSDV